MSNNNFYLRFMEKKQIQLLFQIINVRYQTRCAFCKTGIIKPAPLQKIVRFSDVSKGSFRFAAANFELQLSSRCLAADQFAVQLCPRYSAVDQFALQPSSRYSAADQFVLQPSSRYSAADHLQRKLRSRNKKSREVQPLKKDNGVVIRHSSTFSLSHTLPFTHSSPDFGSNDN